MVPVRRAKGGDTAPLCCAVEEPELFGIRLSFYQVEKQGLTNSGFVAKAVSEINQYFWSRTLFVA